MTLVITLLIQIPLLPGAAIGILALAIIRVRSDGRSNRLTDFPRSRVQGITRRFLSAGAQNDNPDRDHRG
jgi:hypothetical protein